MGRSVPETVCIDGIESTGPGGSPEERVYEIELITPMYGGGVVAGVVDEEMPVRATSIRGHLRFWWRLLYGLKLSLNDMRKEEAAIFGSTQSASKVALRVRLPDTRLSLKAMASISEEGGKKKIVFETGKNKLQYAIFPFQGKIGKKGEPDVAPSLALVNAGFKLLLSFSPKLPDAQREQVLNSLHGWINFGGLGARARRGCGALYSKDCAMESTENISSLLTGAPGIETVLMGNVKDDAESAWCEMVGLIKQFRQGAGIGRNEGQSKEKTKTPGRSRWPEPDTIRGKVEAHLERHAPTMQVEGFPRARFGMPIIFHFKDSDFGGKSKPGMDPIDTCLQPESSSRMASPVLLSPVKLKNGKVVPMIIFLKTGPLCSLLLERSDTKDTYPISSDQIINPKFSTYNNSPMKGRSNNGDALEAFRAYLKERDYRR
ncbi:type III-B CRISPR module RAMP protein Cmr1 [Fretibacterium sp. OH1220_COT-178]|uniref:type III-B CRISPR module RAMP protein Cmr1 n=1 Tax=Fretibacterium sp. OH1220_COT-178 TaxID=2491047 RepID=UPI000F5DAA0E|nr:type III-B CRISPR module RAMP protein Cmr1 [Fretibacterium sp. OH1220_COT-178]RRD64214.1 type III-B CRISPR module RAMP protein Cmr1 [Fretibacterium sp. OH1220_COT-178]